MKIHRLPKEVYDLIAAGEVVLAPVSVVKELLENSLDAGADRITVEILEGGIGRIRVSDNGAGIDSADIELAFAPHATSKLNSADDLLRIETLGFRGEALASIAAVSCVTMVTKTSGEGGAIRVFTEGGSGLSLTQAGADAGTNVIVEKLFFNIPARKKHLGNPQTEGRKIIEYLSKAAVSRPDAAIRLISDGKFIFATLGNGDRLAAIAAVYGSKTAENLISVNAEKSDSPRLRLEGYISGVLGMRGNRKGQHFFVNGRPVSNAVIENAVHRAYHEYAEPGRFPVALLFLEAEPSMVDVNVHPSKSEISFAAPDKISAFVYDSIRGRLISGSAIPKLRKNGWTVPDPTFYFDEDQRKYDHTGNGSTAGNDAEIEPETKPMVSTSGGKGEKVLSVDINSLLSTNQLGNNVNNMLDNNELLSSKSYQDSNSATSRIFGEETDYHYEKRLNINELRVLALLFATYILATDGDCLYIVDQHAAHERVLFEQFKENYGGEAKMQELLTPYLFTPPALLNDLSKYTVILRKIGFQIEEFGVNTWAARTFPAFISLEEGEIFLLDFLSTVEDESGKDAGLVSDVAFDRIIMRACKASVKANRLLSNEECKALLDSLSECGNPYTCPHGRPVFLKLTRRDIERLFKRG